MSKLKSLKLKQADVSHIYIEDGSPFWLNETDIEVIKLAPIQFRHDNNPELWLPPEWDMGIYGHSLRAFLLQDMWFKSAPRINGSVDQFARSMFSAPRIGIKYLDTLSLVMNKLAEKEQLDIKGRAKKLARKNR